MTKENATLKKLYALLDELEKEQQAQDERERFYSEMEAQFDKPTKRFVAGLEKDVVPKHEQDSTMTTRN